MTFATRKWLIIAVAAAVLLLAVLAVRGWRQPEGAPPADGQFTADAAPISRAAARVVLAASEHDFGDLPSQAACEHVFLLRNEGGAPLKLTRGPTTCKCTMSQLPAEPVPPGGEAQVLVASKTENLHGFFSHGATIYTNDPQRPAIEFKLLGIVRATIAAAPPRLMISDPRQSRSVKTLVFSQVWDDFVVTQARPSNPGMEWKLAPAAADQLPPLKARAAQQLEITLPADLPAGRIWEGLDLTVASAKNSQDTRQLTVEVVGEKSGPFAIYGSKIDDQGVLTLGAAERGEGLRARMTLKVRDPPRQFQVRRIAVEPQFLQVRVEPYQPDNPALGLYRVDVEVPRDAPPCGHQGMLRGQVGIETDHPVVGTVRFFVDFAVIGSNS